MKKYTFEEFLSEEFIKHNNPTKDNYEDMFNKWLENIDGNILMDLAEKWGEKVRIAVDYVLQKELETWAKESIGAKAVESVMMALQELNNI